MSAPAGPALLATGVTKRFAGTLALADAALRVRQGTVHALLGGNGAGKSTLVKVLAGVEAADSGQVHVLGRSWPAGHGSPHLAHQAGLRFVHQDLGLFDGMTVAENIALAAGFPTHLGTVRWRRLHRRVADLLDRYEIDAHPAAVMSTLPPVTRTMVAVTRALQDQDGHEYVLVLDEPTASLPEHETHLLLRNLRRRADLGQTIVLVSHRLREVREVADDITVLRDGRVAGTVVARTADEDELVGYIAGRSPARDRAPRPVVGAPVLRIRGLRAGALAGVDLTLHAGEIVGLASLSGREPSALLAALFGAQPVQAGSISHNGRDWRNVGPHQAIRAGTALVPRDRLRDAAFPDMSVRHNASATVLTRYWRRWGFDVRAERDDTRHLLRSYAVAAPDTEAPLGTLSGGNQQKLLLARWLRDNPRLLLLDEPTQSVDVLARADIHRLVRAAAAAGCAVLIASGDHHELASLCHRVVVLRDGRVVGDLPAATASPDRITHLVQYPDTSPEDMP
jgi:ribose transport system ATP-binding protein